MRSSLRTLSILLGVIVTVSCQTDNGKPEAETPDFYFGADLSYVNQIVDKGGVYKDQGEQRSPYRIFKDHGSNLVRLRLWHNPAWTKEVYGAEGTQLYNDLKDVEKGIRLSKEQGLNVLLDFHYSDMWADPGRQEIPKAWQQITSMSVLKDSVYNYTFKTLTYLNHRELMPEFVQIGNETNCGMMYSQAPDAFPALNGCDGHWARLGEVVNTAIDAVRDVSANSTVKTKVIIHVADPKNVEYYFDNLTATGRVTDFDIVGVSFYPIWHTTVKVDQLSNAVTTFKSKYGKDVMILETAYPWTSEAKDAYNNLWGSETPIEGYPYTVDGQLSMMKKITQEVKDGGGIGVIYWEPAWISSSAKDLWGTGSSWENNTFFDFQGNVIPSIDFMNAVYTKQ